MKSNRKTVFLQPTRLAIISDSVTLGQTPAEATGPRTASHGVPVYYLSFSWYQTIQTGERG